MTHAVRNARRVGTRLIRIAATSMLLGVTSGTLPAVAASGNTACSCSPLVVDAPARPVRAGTSPVVHVVRDGETLSSIAVRYQVSVKDLTKHNKIAAPDKIDAGSKLTVPVSAAVAKLPSRLLSRPERLALRPRFAYWAKRNGLPVDLLEALAWLESGWDNQKVSNAGAIGVGQLLPDTVRFVSTELIGEELDPTVADHNIRMSARYLRFLLKATDGDVRAALGGYYQGLRSVHQNGTYEQTRRYAADVLALRRQFSVD